MLLSNKNLALKSLGIKGVSTAIINFKCNPPLKSLSYINKYVKRLQYEGLDATQN